jgi:hypothetical protein
MPSPENPYLVTLRPRRSGTDRSRGVCDLTITVNRFSGRVEVAGGPWGADHHWRVADDAEVEALADRFDLQELRDVLALRRRDGARAAARRD